MPKNQNSPHLSRCDATWCLLKQDLFAIYSPINVAALCEEIIEGFHALFGLQVSKVGHVCAYKVE